jgi:hypothetical protein
MSKLHHSTLKAAVGKYQPLFTEGKSEADIKAEIANDEKKFDEDAINEIYAAIVNTDSDTKGSDGDKGSDPGGAAKGAKPKAHIVSSPFRDIANFNKEWKVGSDVSHFDQERLKKLVELNLVTVK